jgi:hypothetical protein
MLSINTLIAKVLWNFVTLLTTDLSEDRMSTLFTISFISNAYWYEDQKVFMLTVKIKK